LADAAAAVALFAAAVALAAALVALVAALLMLVVAEFTADWRSPIVAGVTESF